MIPPEKKNGEPRECSRWAQSLVAGKGYCNQHAGGILEEERVVRQAAFKKAELDRRIDLYLARQRVAYAEAAL